MRTLHHVHVKITLAAPWLVHGNDPGAWGLESVQLRGPNGQRVLPGTLLVGRLREAWAAFDAVAAPSDQPAPDWLGRPASGRRQPERARLMVDDLSCTDDRSGPASTPLAAHRVHIDEASGAGLDGDLQMIEQHEPPGTSVSFSGTWHMWMDEHSDEPARLAHWIRKGLQWHTQLGALRSVGFGEVRSVEVRCEAAAAQTECWGGPDALRPGLRLRFDQPLAVGNQLIGGNLFVSDDVIVGAALKGALAHGLRAAGRALPEWFNALRLSHAHPAPKDQLKRPIPLPLSLVSDRHGIFDAVEGGKAGSDLPLDLLFQPDWKSADEILAGVNQGWGKTENHLRVRTAIKNGQADDGQLFAYECKVGATTHWLSHVSFTDEISPEARSARLDELGSTLGTSLGPIGKTDAFAELTWIPDLPPVWPSAPVTEGTVRLALVSPALLFASTTLPDADLPPDDVLALYRAAFEDLAQQAGHPGAITLSHCFVQHELAGGDYLWERFMSHHPATAARGYLPYVLTQAGSVFVFDIHDVAQANVLLTRWSARGLALPTSVREAHGDRWDCNPYLPENGYGEVAVNPMHGFPPAGQAHPTKGA